MLSTMQDAQLSIGRLMRHGTQVHGASEVITWSESGPRRATYAEVGRRTARLANALRALGVTGDQRVGTFMWNNQEHLETYLAVPAMGAVLHTLNIRLLPEQVAYIANHAADHVVIADASLLPLLTKIVPFMTTVRHIVVNGAFDRDSVAAEGIEVHAYDELLAAASEDFDWPDTNERDAAAMCYTSGTTGNPKGVVYSHRSIWLHSTQVCMTDGLGLSQSDRALAIVPMFHAMSWGLPYAALMCGATLIMPDRFLQPEPIAAMIESERPSFTAAVPTIWQGLLQHLQSHPADLSSLNEVIVGGSACPPSLMREFNDKYGVHIIHAWGMTETSPLGSIARPPAGLSEDEAWEYRFTQGRLPAAVEGRLVGDGGEILPSDGKNVGELEVRGPWITAAYYEPADSTEPPATDKFDNGWLRTGDVGTLSPDGFLRLTDRAKDVIKSGGEWISSVELENHVMAHPAVAEAAVIGVPDPKWSERPLVAVVFKEGQSATPAELREFLGGRVARWQLPEHWTVISEVPKTSVGKYDKKRLRRQHSDGALTVQDITE